ncbi:AMP-dependent synthetase/ligase [Demequina muriae]|uniref:Long-chain fatty acid--CoA ligase n=1 Tax=Demequina muriae TaxID=3051664 RepID=A0ABT8GIH9_9MICO|nr:long-chain fatty acid--CoA ligase [Demequina sp. EGI L300058]MDN4481241.1 long-chain fatty acid--CoA ligase [Demequina sp. EGI L300058]
MTAEMSTPTLVQRDEITHLTAMLAARAHAAPDAAFAEVKDADGTWRTITLAEYHSRVRAVAKGLISRGVKAGDRVGIMGDTRYEWSVMDFAILAAGAVSVPVYPSSSATQVEWMVADAGITLVAVDTAERAGLVTQASVTMVMLDDDGLDALAAAGESVSDTDLDARTADVVGDDIATIIYTSGTTGRPKGAMLSHGNFVEQVLNIERDPGYGGFVAGDDARLLLFLPLAHVFGRIAMILALSAGTVIGFAPSHKTLADDLGTFRPTFLVLVPRVLETVYNRADAAQSGLKKRIFRWSAKVTRQYALARETGTPGLGLRVKLAVADRLVLSKLRAKLGGNLKYALAGGARLNEDVGHFFQGLGVTVLQGYGLTETTAAAMGTPEDANVMGTVGRPIAGNEMKLADDGEILLRGASLFQGYWNAPEATAEVMRDGWFASGDMGEMVNGALNIVGRKKEILVLSSGKNVQPAVLENSMRSHPAIQDSVVVGEGKHFVSALVALDEAMLPAWLKQHELPDMTVEEAANDSRVRDLISRAIALANAHVSRAESIREFRILPSSFSEAREELTASLKTRRSVIMAHYAAVVDEIYSKAMPPSRP